MKRQLLWIVALVLSCGNTLSAQAQYYETKNELNVSIGGAANSEIVSALADFSAVMAEALLTATTLGLYTGSSVSYKNKSYTLPITVGYYRHLSKVVAVGGYVGYNGIKREMYCEKDYIGDAHRTNISVMPSVKFHWVRTKHFGFYSKLGVGATFASEKKEAEKTVTNSSVYFNLDFTPVGLDAGSPQFRGFVELGVGEAGMVSAGLRYKF